jgi:hypothetical protein
MSDGKALWKNIQYGSMPWKRSFRRRVNEFCCPYYTGWKKRNQQLFWFNTKSCGDSNQFFSLSSIKHWKRKIGIYQFLYCFLGGGCGGNRSLASKERFPPQTFALSQKR